MDFVSAATASFDKSVGVSSDSGKALRGLAIWWAVPTWRAAMAASRGLSPRLAFEACFVFKNLRMNLSLFFEGFGSTSTDGAVQGQASPLGLNPATVAAVACSA